MQEEETSGEQRGSVKNRLKTFFFIRFFKKKKKKLVKHTIEFVLPNPASLRKIPDIKENILTPFSPKQDRFILVYARPIKRGGYVVDFRKETACKKVQIKKENVVLEEKKIKEKETIIIKKEEKIILEEKKAEVLKPKLEMPSQLQEKKLDKKAIDPTPIVQNKIETNFSACIPSFVLCKSKKEQTVALPKQRFQFKKKGIGKQEEKIIEKQLPKEMSKKKNGSFLFDDIVLDVKKSSQILQEIDQYLNDLEEEIQKKDLEECQIYFVKLREIRQYLKEIEIRYYLLNEDEMFQSFGEFKDSILWDQLDCYKFGATKQDLLFLHSCCKEEAKKLVHISQVMMKEQKITKKLNDKKEYRLSLEQQFSIKKAKIKTMSSLEQEFIKQIQKIEEQLKELQMKIKTFNQEYADHKLFSKFQWFLKIMVGWFSRSHSKKSKFWNKAQNSINKRLERPQTSIALYGYQNFSLDLKYSMHDLSYLKNLLMYYLKDIALFKEDFIKQFASENESIDEYHKIIFNLDSMETLLLNQTELIDGLESVFIQEEKQVDEKIKILKKKGDI